MLLCMKSLSGSGDAPAELLHIVCIANISALIDIDQFTEYVLFGNTSYCVSEYEIIYF